MNLLAIPLLGRILGGVSLFAIVGLSIALVVAKGETRHWHKVADQNEAKYRGEAAAHAQTVANYRTASSEAQRRNDAQVALIESRYDAEGRKATNALAEQLSELRRLNAAHQLQPAAPYAHPSGPGGHQTGSAPQSAARTVDPTWVCVAPETALRSAESETRHDALIDWVLAIGQPR